MSKNIFKFIGSINFDPLSPEEQLKLEILKYKKGISPQLERMKGLDKKKVDKEKYFDSLMQAKSNHRNLQFEYGEGEVYPKDISAPDIQYIQYAEPHVIITDWYDEEHDWYRMPQLIKGFAEESYLSYELGMWFSSLSAAINCCEYLLKYEYLRYVNSKDKAGAEILSKDKHFSLGTFTQNGNTYLTELKLNTYHDKIQYLNDVRISLYHFNPERAKKVSQKGKSEVEKSTPLLDDMVLPIIAYRVYCIMLELIDELYNQKKAVEYIKEGIQDWMNKRGLTEEGLKNEE